MSVATMAKQANKLAVVVGLGQTGLSVVPHLLARGFDVEVVDTREHPPQLDTLLEAYPRVPVHKGEYHRDLLCRADLLVVSPGVALAEPAVSEARKSGVEIAGDIELFARSAKAPVIAVTGANGKSTVSVLVGEMCSEAGLETRLGGNIGVPALELIRDNEPDVYVLELSSFQLETTESLDAVAAVVLNISEDHMDRYPSLQDYADTKARIYRGTGAMILNLDDPIVMKMSSSNREQVYFGMQVPARDQDYGIREIDGSLWLVRGKEALFSADEIRVPGNHNISNVLAAMALVQVLGVSTEAAKCAVQKFTGLPHRCQLVAESGDVKWINDSKATNVGATTAALMGIDQPVIWIAGGEGKDADFAPLKNAATGRVRDAILIGRDARLIEQALASNVPVHRADDMKQAVALAHSMANPGDVVMLSPACASFDMFRNFVDRGETFMQLVREQLQQ
jgi:UDP-N-acetylmuramoylalanine--D-glutamate ligase